MEIQIKTNGKKKLQEILIDLIRYHRSNGNFIFKRHKMFTVDVNQLHLNLDKKWNATTHGNAKATGRTDGK